MAYLIEERHGEAVLSKVLEDDAGKRTTQKLVSFHAVGSTPDTLAALGHLAASNCEDEADR